MMNITLTNIKLWLSVAVITAGSTLTYSVVTSEKEGSPQSYIVQGASKSTMTEQLNAVGANVTHSFNVINAVSVVLTPSQAAQVSSTNPMLRLFVNSEVKVSAKGGKNKNTLIESTALTSTETTSLTSTDTTTISTNNPAAGRDTLFPTIVRANEAHAMGITGDGVTVAIIDTGMESWFKDLTTNMYGNDRISHAYNVTSTKWSGSVGDPNGHGTHIASVIGNSSPTYTLSGEVTAGYNSIAPGADLVIVKAFDENGQASYADILSAIEYIVENKDALHIKVLNLSFSATPSSNYWEDPINQALMVAWQSGITVVAAAGNQGPDAMTIGVPGNNPYVITVGAMSDNYSPNDLNDDFVTTFSSAGPTYEGFVKPELVAPGGHIQGLMDFNSSIGWGYEMLSDGDDYFLLSGTSQATAITSGIVALMLQDSPTLSPDDIKCRLLSTAKAAVTDDGQLAYSVFQQGAGLVDAMNALNSSALGCGNAGLDIAADIAGEHHYMGPAQRYEENGDFYIPDQQGLEWNGIYSDAHMWGNVRFISDAHMWGNVVFNSDAHMWGNVRFVSDAHMWGNISFNSDAHMWGNVRFVDESAPATDSVQTKWVEHE
jgi:serine protease AprX